MDKIEDESSRDVGRRVVGAEEFADALGISVRTLRAMVARGEVQYRKVGRLTRFVLPDDLDEYLTATRVERKPGGAI